MAPSDGALALARFARLSVSPPALVKKPVDGRATQAGGALESDFVGRWR